MAALGTLKPPRRNSNLNSNPLERRKATSAKRCYGCSQYGHFKSDCPRPNRQGQGAFPLGPSLNAFFVRAITVNNCLSLPVGHQATERSGQARETEKQKQAADPRLGLWRPMRPVLPSIVMERLF